MRGKMARDETQEGSDAAKVKKVKRPTAQKRVLQSEKRRLNNKIFTSSVRTAMRHFDESLQKGDPSVITERLNEVYSLMDKGVQRGIYKINKASRTKARFAARSAAKA
jgi:small subunit ribosomal protein S20